MRNISITVALAATATYVNAFSITDIAANIGDINLGMMTAMQSDMSATTTDCYTAATATND